MRGDDPDYLTARIARDRPDILERMQAGEFKSVWSEPRLPDQPQSLLPAPRDLPPGLVHLEG